MNISKEFLIPVIAIVALALAIMGFIAIGTIVAAVGFYIDYKQTAKENATYEKYKNAYPYIERRKS